MKRCATLSPVHRWLRGAGLALSALLVAGGVLGWQSHARSAQAPEPLVAASAAMPASAASAASAARASATEDTQVIDLDWHDEARHRAVPVRLYWPAKAQAGQPVPLVLFSHGIGGSRRGYSYLGSYWASQGLAALHVQHVGSDRGLWSGNPLQLVGRLQGAAKEDEALNRVQDVRFALDQLLASAYGPMVRRDALLAAGHSYGANTTLLLAGARVERQGKLLELAEPRLRAAIVISAPPFYGEAEPQRILSGVRIPTLHITATDDVIRIPGYYSPATDRLQVFDATGGPSKALAVFQGGSHSIFTDRAGTGGVALNPQVKAATRELTMAFVREQLDGDAAELQAWPQRHAALLNRYQPAKLADVSVGGGASGLGQRP